MSSVRFASSMVGDARLRDLPPTFDADEPSDLVRLREALAATPEGAPMATCALFGGAHGSEGAAAP